MITLPMLFLKPVFRGEVVFPAACHEQKVECKSSYVGYCRENKDLCCGREWISVLQMLIWTLELE